MKTMKKTMKKTRDEPVSIKKFGGSQDLMIRWKEVMKVFKRVTEVISECGNADNLPSYGAWESILYKLGNTTEKKTNLKETG